MGLVILVIVLIHHLVPLAKQSKLMASLGQDLDLVANATAKEVSPNNGLDELAQSPSVTFKTMEFIMRLVIAVGMIYYGCVNGVSSYWRRSNRNSDSGHLA